MSAGADRAHGMQGRLHVEGTQFPPQCSHQTALGGILLHGARKSVKEQTKMNQQACGPSISTVVLALSLSLAAPLLQAKSVQATFKIGSNETTVTSTLDGGATGPGASEWSRTDAKSAGLIKNDNTFDLSKFQTNTDGTVKTITAVMADGTQVRYALSKPIDIKIKDDNGNEKTISIPVTVVADPSRTASNLIGRDWGSQAKATETWANNKVTWDNKASEAEGKKTRTLQQGAPSPAGGFKLEMLGDVQFASATTTVRGTAYFSPGSTYSMLSAQLAASLGLQPIETVDISSSQPGLLSEFEKLGLYSEGANDFGRFQKATLPELVLFADDGSRIVEEGLDILINTASSESVLGQDFLARGMRLDGLVPIREVGYMQETEVLFFSTPEPGSALLVALALGGLMKVRRPASASRTAACLRT